MKNQVGNSKNPRKNSEKKVGGDSLNHKDVFLGKREKSLWPNELKSEMSGYSSHRKAVIILTHLCPRIEM